MLQLWISKEHDEITIGQPRRFESCPNHRPFGNYHIVNNFARCYSTSNFRIGDHSTGIRISSINWRGCLALKFNTSSEGYTFPGQSKPS